MPDWVRTALGSRLRTTLRGILGERLGGRLLGLERDGGSVLLQVAVVPAERGLDVALADEAVAGDGIQSDRRVSDGRNGESPGLGAHPGAVNVKGRASKVRYSPENDTGDFGETMNSSP